jgi:transposase
MTAPLSPKVFTPPDMRVQSCELHDGILSISLRCQRPGECCPCCGGFSTRVHGRYARHIQDLPCQGYRVRLHVDVRRFQCRNAACARQTFAETLPIALRRINAQVGLALGGQPGSRLLTQLGMPLSGDTLLRTLGRRITACEASQPCAEPQEVGIGDWAYRRGQVYGTIVVDLQRRRPIELLPDREASTVAAWLAQHAHIRVVTRDRAAAYAQAIRRGTGGSTGGRSLAPSEELGGDAGTMAEPLWACAEGNSTPTAAGECTNSDD